MRRPTWLVILACVAGACGGRSLPTDQHDGGVRDGAVGDAFLRDGPTDGPYVPDGPYTNFCTQDDHCRVAVRTDNCCEAAYPELIWNIDPNQCVVFWSAQGSTPVPQHCMDAWDPQCAFIDCMPGPPPSRVARCDQRHCEFALECNDPSACMVVVDTRACCPCPMVVPTALYDVDGCLVKYPSTEPPTGCEPQACPAMPCPVCTPVTANCVAQTCESGIR